MLENHQNGINLAARTFLRSEGKPRWWFVSCGAVQPCEWLSNFRMNYRHHLHCNHVQAYGLCNGAFGLSDTAVTNYKTARSCHPENYHWHLSEVATAVSTMSVPIPEVLKMWGPPPGVVLGPLGGHKFLVCGTYLFWMKYGRNIKHILVGT
jgi:hypothetical protein